MELVGVLTYQSKKASSRHVPSSPHCPRVDVFVAVIGDVSHCSAWVEKLASGPSLTLTSLIPPSPFMEKSSQLSELLVLNLLNNSFSIT